MEKKFFGPKAVVGAFLIMFVQLGTATTLGVFLASLSADSGWGVTTCAYIGTACTVSCIICSMIVSKLLAKGTSIKILLTIGLIANAVGMLCYTFAVPGQSIATLVFFYLGGALVGVALTFSAHAVCGAIIATWYIEGREKLIGTVFSGAGFGAAVVVFIAGQMFKFFTWRQCYYILAAFTLIIGFIVVFFLVRDPAKMGQQPKGADKVASSSGAAAELPGMSLSEARKSSSYWLFAVMLLFVCCAGSGFTSYGPAWWQSFGMSSTTAASYQSIYLIVSGLILLCVGAVFGKLGPAMFAIVVFGCYALCNILTSFYAGATGLLIITLVLGAIGYPLQASIPSLCGQAIFGPKEFGAISASLMTFNYIGQFLYAPVMSVCGLKLGWIVYGVFTLIGLALLLAAIAGSPYRKSLKK